MKTYSPASTGGPPGPVQGGGVLETVSGYYLNYGINNLAQWLI